MLGALMIFVAASLGCMLAQDVSVLLACRVMQAVIIAGAVVSSAAIRDRHSAIDSAAKLSLIASAMAVAPMLGPMPGGLLDVTLGWRSVFALYAGLGGALLVLAWADMGETREPGLPAPRLGDWVALLQSGRYWSYVLCTAFSVGAFYVFVTGVPYVATAAWGLSPAEVGIGVGSITGGFIVGAAVSARQARRLGMGVLLVSGRAVSVTVVALALAVFATGVSHPLALFGLTVFVGLGNGLTLPAANAGTMSVRPALAGTAARVERRPVHGAGGSVEHADSVGGRTFRHARRLAGDHHGLRAAVTRSCPRGHPPGAGRGARHRLACGDGPLWAPECCPRRPTRAGERRSSSAAGLRLK